MEFIKKQKIGFALYLIVAVLAVISLIVYVSNVNAPYYEDMNGNVVLLLILAIVSLIGSLVLSQMAENKILKIVCDVLRVAAAVMIIVSVGIFVGMRVESFGYIYGSNLELGNEEAFSAGGQAITGIILMAATWLLSVVASFFQLGKKNTQ